MAWYRGRSLESDKDGLESCFESYQLFDLEQRIFSLGDEGTSIISPFQMESPGDERKQGLLRDTSQSMR